MTGRKSTQFLVVAAASSLLPAWQQPGRPRQPRNGRRRPPNKSPSIHRLRRAASRTGFSITSGRTSGRKQRAELRLVVDVGSTNEEDDQLGLAHFVEDMSFNGTKNFPKPPTSRSPGPSRYWCFHDYYRKVNPAMVQEAARTYLNMQNYVKVTLFPEKKSFQSGAPPHTPARSLAGAPAPRAAPSRVRRARRRYAATSKIP
jgi:hypothetical protein